MTEIKIPFNAWSSARLRAGKKHSTWRSKQYGKKGDTFTHEGRQYRIIHEPFKIKMMYLISHLWDLEGASSWQELESVLKQIKRSECLDMNQEGWLHIFAEV